MDIIHIIVLAVVQGLTEFLPISSSAHLILVPLVTDWPDQGLAFDVAVHVGTLTAVVLYFRKEINIEFVSRMYFIGIMSIKDIDLFPDAKNNMKELMTTYLNYHIRALATEKGVKKLNQILSNENTKN